MYNIRIIPHDQIYSIIPFLRILNDKIEESVLEERLNEMITRGYECVGIFDNDKLIGVSGLWILMKYYVGRHIEPDNVVVHPDYRNKGIGEKLLNWIYEYGRSEGCSYSELNCYVANEKAHKFWFNQGYKILGFHFQKQL